MNNTPGASRAVIIHKDGILCMFRRIIIDNLKKEYYVSIGGGCEEGEGFEEALHRECMEEAGVEVVIQEELMDYHNKENDKISRIFICNSISKTFHPKPLEGSPEALNTHDNNLYEIHHIPWDELSNIDLRPLEIRNALLEWSKKNNYID